MLLRDEHLLEHLLASECARCRCPAEVREEWHLRSLYRFSTCPRCGREESVLLRKLS